MSKFVIIIMSIFLIPLTTTSCASKQDAGALTGAVVGATVGSHVGKGSGRIAAMFFSAIIGSELGKAIGQHMDERDRMRTVQVLEYNKTRQYSSWHNPDTGRNYRVAPTRTYSAAKGPCREFHVDSQIGGKTQQLYGTACRQADGSWEMQK